MAFTPTFLNLADLVGTPLVHTAEITNTGAMTNAVDGLGAIARTWPDGTPLVAGDYVAGDMILERYDGTAFRMQKCLSPTQVRALMKTGRTPQVLVYNSSGTWTKPANFSHSFFEMKGAGGSGAVDSGVLGTMGCSGGILRFWRDDTDMGASHAYVIGAGGAVVGSGSAANGNAGSATTFLGASAAGGGGGWTGNTSAVPGTNNLNSIPGESYSGFPVGNQIRMQSPHGLGYTGYGGGGGQVGSQASVGGGPGVIIEQRFFK